MPANFSNLRLKYTHEAVGSSIKPLSFIVNLSSLDFELSQNTIGPGLPFFAELTFEAKLEKTPDVKLDDLAKLAKQHFAGLKSKEPCDIMGEIMRNQMFISDNIQLDFQTYSDEDTPESADLLSNVQTSITTFPGREGCCETDLCAYAGKVSFIFPRQTGVNIARQSSKVTVQSRGASPPPTQPSLMHPVLEFTGAIMPIQGGEEFEEIAKAFIRVKYEPQASNTEAGRLAVDQNTAAQAIANAVAEGFSGPFTTSLQPFNNKPTLDLALWVLIKKGTDGLSFKNYLEYMDFIFCGGDAPANLCCPDAAVSKIKKISTNRALPFMNVDAYRAVKVATEAFVMVNCMVHGCFNEEDLTNLTNRVPLANGNFSPNQLNTWWTNYLEKVNGGPHVIPYFAAILRKMGDEPFKNSTFEDTFQSFIDTGADNTNKCYGILTKKLSCPCFLELIWSYWHEESMMVQGLNAVLRRFQNIKGPLAVDPLANLEIDPLRPLNNLTWGIIQDEQHLLSVRRRAYEYDHHYGISLRGDATRNMRFADSRSKFIEAMHTLLNLTSRFYKQADDMTVRPDGFPVLNGLKETHLILSEGAHNQWGDLPSTARAEMLMQQWLLARPEFREYLPSRVMVAYPEPWMDRVAALNNIMNWTKTSVLHFNYLAIYGEKILLSIRFGNWADPGIAAGAASNWASFWRPEIQGYIHAYRAATGVDLSADGVATGNRVDSMQPSVHLYRRLMEQENGKKVA